MKLHTRIALRYIFSVRSFHMISVITLISIIGIVVGVAALIIVLSIFNGFGEFAEQQMIGLDPHIRITAAEGAWINSSDSLLGELKSLPQVEAASPVIQGRVVMTNKNNMQVVYLNAVKPDEVSSITGITQKIIMGSFDLRPDSIIGGAVLGAGIADRLGIYPFDTISVMSPAMIEKSIRTNRKKSGLLLVVTGIFQTHTKDYDDIYIYSGDAAGAKVFGLAHGQAFAIDIRLKDIKDVEPFSNELAKRLPAEFSVKTWYSLHEELYSIMKLEKIATFIVLSLIIIIAVFNVLASLSMTVVKKKPDIALMKALGWSSAAVGRIFRTQGIIIGFISTFLGVIIGVGFCLGKIRYNWFEIDSSKYLVPSIPISLHITDVIIITAFSLLLSWLATIFPARRAASTVITSEIRSE